MLVRLIYASRAKRPIDEAMLVSILETARARNHEHGITGVLCASPSSGIFLQVLEGSRQAVNRLYTNLVRDDRHTDVTLISHEETDSRQFTAWQMGSVDLEKVNRSTVLRFSEHAELDPFSLSATAAAALIEELAERASVDGRTRAASARS